VVEPSESLYPVLDLLRAHSPMAKAELAQRTGLTRKVVVQRVEELIACGLAEEAGLGRSTGGRAPRQVRFRADGATVLVAEVAATSITAGLADLGGTILAEIAENADPAAGPEATLKRVEALFDQLLATSPAGERPVWGVGIGVPGPVAMATGRPVGALAIPGWADYPVRDRLAARYEVPVWVDNEVNLMALGEIRSGSGHGHQDLVLIKVGTGIGGAIVSSGVLNRGAQGFAGEIGHVVVDDDVPGKCWCGQTGCLTQIAGARALGAQGEQAAREGHSPILAAILAQVGHIGAREVFAAAAAGDPTSTGLLTRAGEMLGQVAAVLVNGLNPSLVLLGGGLVDITDPLVTAFRTTVEHRCLPSATADLRIRTAALGNPAGLIGAAHLVVDELLSPRRLGRWSASGTPAGLADTVHHG
jgi:glucokinase-like ROK family protein